ncbi:hydroxyacylglutathione hydrolase [Ferrimonas lipolytica]|uniref:Hydroxyacylglutathione hydrolase n=1 Tax=Ferrimonas lipolytica TaxID=2724191 RepID=A0A6H1UER7_9GAMM|nr:hydroxyacylglutathione hydrolase [Ferrimonas lipolytica]QIZ76833.1 hydroxyacylglutathione hydrolase [Ferrimonas lipolytica]
MNISVQPIPAFNDNYIWCLIHNSNAWVVDPGCAQSVRAFINEHRLTLKGVLVTHHHADHTGGIEELKHSFSNLTVIGPQSANITGLTTIVSDQQHIDLSGLPLELTVVALPGHTLDHIGYYNEQMLFCGDTLFSGGCGRLFEGTPLQLHNSLQRLTQLPNATKVYCTHEYTCANLRFAVMVEPDNQQLLDYQQQCIDKRAQSQPTLPSSIEVEKAINPFLRCDQNSVRTSLERHSQHSLVDNVSRFAALRSWKDNA